MGAMAWRGTAMAKKKGKKDSKPRLPRNPGLPDKDTVISERTFTSPKGMRYRIIRTTEKDPYDSPDGDNGNTK
jgi:hypothetical protein